MEADPLILIDGVIVQNENGKAVLGGLDPDRIERIEVIRGKAAEALYGEAAANGVIQVYLKKK
jgi:outer membrane receptor for ferrienterochelin and colicin